MSGKFEESLPLFADCFKGQRALLGNEDKVTLASLMNLASSLENLHRFSEAVPLYSEAVRGEHYSHISSSHISYIIRLIFINFSHIISEIYLFASHTHFIIILTHPLNTPSRHASDPR